MRCTTNRREAHVSDFETPESLLVAPHLPLHTKRALLEEWSKTLVRQSATTISTGRQRGAGGAGGELLRRVRSALTLLESPSSRHGR